MARDVPGCRALVVEDLGQQRLPARALVAVLRRAGFDARLVHLGPASDPEPLAILAKARRPRLVILSILFTSMVAESLDLAARLRAAGVNAHISMTGPLPTFAHAELLAACPALDSVLRGEADESAVLLAAALRDGGDWRALPGVAHRATEAGAAPAPPNLDALPFPVRDDPIPNCLGLGFATVEGSRGCYHACTFCLPRAFHRLGKPSYRLRSIPALVDEIEALYRKGARLFLFDDEQFLPPGRARQARVAALGEALAKRGLEIAFTIKCRADDVEEALFRRLREAGLIRAYVGVESGCPATLQLINKGVSAGQSAQALALLDGLGIVADFSDLLFHPWSTLETIQTELTFLARVLPHIPTPFTFREVVCYPGTPLGERLRAEGRAAGPPWVWAYTIADPRAELLRRLARVIFGRRDAAGGLHERVARAWYEHLLARRFGLKPDIQEEARALREAVTHVNREALAVWQEMLDFAAGCDLEDVPCINAQAAHWAGRINASEMDVPLTPLPIP